MKRAEKARHQGVGHLRLDIGAGHPDLQVVVVPHRLLADDGHDREGTAFDLGLGREYRRHAAEAEVLVGQVGDRRAGWKIALRVYCLVELDKNAAAMRRIEFGVGDDEFVVVVGPHDEIGRRGKGEIEFLEGFPAVRHRRRRGSSGVGRRRGGRGLRCSGGTCRRRGGGRAVGGRRRRCGGRRVAGKIAEFLVAAGVVGHGAFDHFRRDRVDQRRIARRGEIAVAQKRVQRCLGRRGRVGVEQGVGASQRGRIGTGQRRRRRQAKQGRRNQQDAAHGSLPSDDQFGLGIGMPPPGRFFICSRASS